MSLVVYFDCAYKLSLSDLQACLLKSCDQDEVIGLEAVSRLHVIRPDSSRQLLNQLRNVESYILSLPSKDVVLSAVILSDLSVFYWSERWSEEEARFQDSTTTEGKAYSRESLHTMILTEVGRLQKMFQCVVVVSGLGVTSDRVSPIRTGLAGPWIKAVDIRIVLKRSINDRMEGEIDGRKWVAACGGDSRIGEAKCEIQVSVDGLELVQLHHGI